MGELSQKQYIDALERRCEKLEFAFRQVQDEVIALAAANSDLRSELHALREAIKYG